METPAKRARKMGAPSLAEVSRGTDFALSNLNRYFYRKDFRRFDSLVLGSLELAKKEQVA